MSYNSVQSSLKSIPEGGIVSVGQYDNTLKHGTQSARLETTSGVREGCILAPALFCVAIDWILNHMTVRLSINIESFHMKCQRRILGIKWHDFVRNSEVSLRTGLAPVSDRITRGRNAIFGHVERMPDNTPAHQTMLRQVELSVG